jgi:hypothetical protein
VLGNGLRDYPFCFKRLHQENEKTTKNRKKNLANHVFYKEQECWICKESLHLLTEREIALIKVGT